MRRNEKGDTPLFSVHGEKGSVPFLLFEAALCVLIFAAPLPFGSVGPPGRLALELGALALTAAWTVYALLRPVALPPRAARAGIFGLLALATVQTLPIGAGAVALLSPAAAGLRAGLDPVPSAALSLAPDATASALRTGAALAGVLLVATSVAAARGVSRLAAACAVSAAFQGLYGLLVLVSGHDRIWNVPKTAYLESATGTFVNRNHFAGFLVATLPPALGLVFALARRARERGTERSRLGRALGDDGSRALLVALLALAGLAGLLLSFSRAGTALGLAAAAATIAVAWRGRPAARAAAVALLVAVAAVPLLDVGADRLALRYAASAGDLAASGGRWDVWRDTLRIVAAFPLFGCGFGAFTWTFPAFASPAVDLHYTHAHNDLVQLAAEGGLLAAGALALVLVPLARAAGKVLRRAGDPVAVGAAIGLGGLLLHGLVDFNFHIPANAALACLLAGCLFGATWTARS